MNAEIFNLELNTHTGTALSCALGHKDKDTHLHCMRVVELTRQIGIQIGIQAQDLRLLEIAAIFHDIGKLGVPDDILSKPGKLNDDEWMIMQKHTEIGEDIVSRLDIVDSVKLASIVRHHHEHYNGNGYPDGLSGKAIPLLSRIISVADSYDALVSTREYRTEMPHKAAISIMKQEVGTKFDPDIAEVFFSVTDNAVQFA